MRPSELSELLGIPTSTLANWRCAGVGPAYFRVGRHVRYRPADVDAWLDGQRQATDDGAGGTVEHGVVVGRRTRPMGRTFLRPSSPSGA